MNSNERYLEEFAVKPGHKALNLRLKKPGDFIIYKLEEDEHYTVQYFRELLLHANVIEKSNPNNQYGKFLIKKEDFESFNEIRELEEFIAQKLITQVTWVFNQVLTCSSPLFDDTIDRQKRNQRFKKGTVAVLKAIDRQPCIVNTIASSTEDQNTISNYIEAWNTKDLFQDIQGRDPYHEARNPTQKISDSMIMLTAGAIKDEFLNLKSEQYIAVVRVYLIDYGATNIKLLSQLGANYVPANNNNNSHLLSLNKLLFLGLSLEKCKYHPPELNVQPKQSIGTTPAKVIVRPERDVDPSSPLLPPESKRRVRMTDDAKKSFDGVNSEEPQKKQYCNCCL